LVRRRGEVAIVVAHENRDTARDGWIDLVGRLAPLLHGVIQEDVLIHEVGDLGEVCVVLLAQLHDGNLLVLAKGQDELSVELFALLLSEGKLEGCMVEGHGHERALDVGEHLVLIGGPLREAREELVHALVGGVVDMRAILVDEDSGLVMAIVGIAGDMVPALEDADLKAAGLCEAACAYGTGITGADDDDIVRIGREGLGKTALNAH